MQKLIAVHVLQRQEDLREPAEDDFLFYKISSFPASEHTDQMRASKQTDRYKQIDKIGCSAESHKAESVTGLRVTRL